MLRSMHHRKTTKCVERGRARERERERETEAETETETENETETETEAEDGERVKGASGAGGMAEAVAEDGPRALLLLVCGLPGSGKSSFCAALLARLQASVSSGKGRVSLGV